MNQPSCKERVTKEWADRKADLVKLWETYENGKEEAEDIGSIYDYGLGFDYVAPRTFKDQRKGYFRYQFSWGGPSDEIRYYIDGDHKPYRIEYWFLDWFDGAHKVLSGKDFELMSNYFEWFNDTGIVQDQLHKAEVEA